ncbi:MAG: YlbF family regulator [Clostridia bacterium]|nr:YlbF family regulator [Clostridia bacterium]MBR2943915.1 YlbF family regulator [Clostridia bacterium]
MEIMELAAQLGQAIKADARIAKMEEAKVAYEKDEKIQALMLEYNTQQIALAEEYKKETVDQKIIEAIENRLNEIVEAVTSSETFIMINKAQEDVNALMNEVNAEIEFQITGQRPCAHDCSSCGSDCGHHHH